MARINTFARLTDLYLYLNLTNPVAPALSADSLAACFTALPVGLRNAVRRRRAF